jgi:hypothetical protein
MTGFGGRNAKYARQKLMLEVSAVEKKDGCIKFYKSILIIYCWYALSVFPSYSEEVNQSKTWKTLLMHGARVECTR